MCLALLEGQRVWPWPWQPWAPGADVPAGETDKQEVTPVVSDVGRAMKNPHSPGRWSRAGGRATFNEVAWERISEKVTFVSRSESQKGADGRSSGGS